MKPISISHVRIDKELSIKDFESFLKNKGSGESKSFFAGKTHLGNFLLHRLPKEADGKLARLGYFLSHSAERHTVRQQLKEFLTDKNIVLTADIRKALPSRFSSGNADGLLKAIHAASADADFIVSSFREELRGFDWMSPLGAGTLNRGNSITTTAPTRLLKQDFEPGIKRIMTEVKTEIELNLTLGYDADKAMLAGYKTLISEVSKMPLSDQFTKVAKRMAVEVNSEMLKRVRNEPDAGKHETIARFATECKKNIIPSLVLRTLMPTIIDQITSDTTPGTRPDGTPTLAARGVKLTALTEQLKNQFNPQTTKKFERSNTGKSEFPEFYAYLSTETNRLKTSMPALQALEQEVLNMGE